MALDQGHRVADVRIELPGMVVAAHDAYVGTCVPHLVCLLAIPAKGEDIIAILQVVRHLQLVYDAKLERVLHVIMSLQVVDAIAAQVPIAPMTWIVTAWHGKCQAFARLCRI